MLTIRQFDLNTLQPGTWLNDTCISFYLDHLTETVGKNKQIMYIEAAVFNTIKMCQDEEDLFDMFGMLGLDKALAVICPLNDAEDASRSGSHWAFMVVLRQSLDSQLDCLFFDSSYSNLGSVASEAAA